MCAVILPLRRGGVGWGERGRQKGQGNEEEAYDFPEVDWDV